MIAASSVRSDLRMLRGSQSFWRSSSSIAPRIRCDANVSNWQPCASSKREAASISPIMPAWMMSSICTDAGSLAAR